MKNGQFRVAYKVAVAILAGAACFHAASHAAAEGTTASAESSAVAAGSAALQSGAFEEAVSQFSAALDSETLPRETVAIVYLNRGLAYQRQNMLVEAIEDYDYALQQNVLTPPTRALALYNRGLANRRLYRTTLALEDFTNALILNPRFSQAYNSRANVLRELGYYATAVEDYDAAIRHEHPQLHIPFYGRALAQAALNDVNGAKQSLARALQAQPGYEPAQVLLARIRDVTPEPGDGESVVADGADDIQTGSITQTAQTEIQRTPSPFAEQNASGETRTAQQATPGDVVATPAGGPDPQVATASNTRPAAGDDGMPGQTQVYVPGPGIDEALGRQDSLDAQSDAITTASIQPEQATSQQAVQPAIPDGYMVQLSAQRDRAAATDVWNRLAERHDDILGDLTPYVIEADLGSRGIFYRIRAGVFTSRDEGNSVCSKLKARRVDCFVVESHS